MRDQVEILFATLVAMRNIEKSEDTSIDELISLRANYSDIYKGLDPDIQHKVDLVNFDGDAHTSDLMRSYDILKGEMPEHFEEEVIMKAFASEGNDPELLKAGRINIANLTPVRRKIQRKDGRTYYKTVYIKREEMSTATNRGRAFLAQNAVEQDMSVGDKVMARFVGWSTGTEYVTDKLEIKEIKDDSVILKFTENTKPKKADGSGVSGFTYGPGARYDQGREITIPRVKSSEWKESTSFQKKPEPRVTDTRIRSSSELSVGDKVIAKVGGSLKEVKVSYIHPRGEFVKVETLDGKKYRRTPTSLKRRNVDVEKKKKKLDDRAVRKLKEGGAHINISTAFTRADLERIESFNNHFEGFDLEEFVTDMRKIMKEEIGPRESDALNMDFNISPGGNWQMSLRGGGLTMDRRFRVTSNGQTSVDHSYFKIDAAHQGSDAGKKMFKALYKQYRNAGIAKISVHANIDVGGYAWGRYGFTCTKATAESLAHSRFTVGRTSGHIEGYRISATDQVNARETIRDFYRTNPSSRRFPVDLLCNTGPGRKAGKVALIRSDWRGELDLTNEAQRAHVENYIGFSG